MTFNPPLQLEDTYLMPYGLTSKGRGVETGYLLFPLFILFAFFNFVMRLCTLCISVSLDVIRSRPRTSNKSRLAGCAVWRYSRLRGCCGMFIPRFQGRVLYSISS